MKIIATKMPIGVKATLMPHSASGAPSQPFCANQRRQRHAGNGGRQRERDVDNGVKDTAAGKLVTHQHPDDHHTHHQIDDGGQEREAEGNPQRVEGAAGSRISQN